MSRGFHLLISLHDLAVFVDDVSDPSDSPVLPSIHALLLPRAVLSGHFVVHICKQREVQFVLRSELLMGFLSIGRDAQHDRAQLLQRTDIVAKCASLNRAARRQVLRVKVQNDLLALEV